MTHPAGTPKLTRPDGSPVRVLVVDDDTALAEMIGIVLRNDGFEPTFCATGDAALEAFRSAKPDVKVA